MKKSIFVGLLGVLLIVGAAAKAATITTTVTGSLVLGVDYLGIFVPGGSPDLTGQAFKLVTVLDTGAADYTSSNPGSFEDQVGGISAVLTISGNDLSYDGSGSQVSASASTAGYFLETSAASPTFSSYYVDYDLEGPTTPSLTSLQNFDCGGSFFCEGQFILSDAVNSTYGIFDIADVKMAVTPISAALPLFISALAGMGFLGYRRRMAKQSQLSN
jgi:hypothetical protein